MKLLVFAHKPPPHHGQSYMVELLLDALDRDARAARDAGRGEPFIECHHVDARFSSSIQDVGQARWGKVFLAIRYALQAIWIRFRHGVTHFYYVPAFPERTPVYRDWIVLGLCRPFFSKCIFHFHAVGLGQWLATQARPWERWISWRIHGRPDLSLVLLNANRDDAQQLSSRRIEVMPNGVPDPCPQFDAEVQPRRAARAAFRQALFTNAKMAALPEAGSDPQVFRVLFLSLCFRPKGLFDTVEAVALANRQLPAGTVRVELTVAGSFWLESEKKEFEERTRQADLCAGGPQVNYRGFVTGEEKARLLRESDCLCFPTYYAAESFGLVLVEALAHGLPVITTRWRGIPEILPPDYPGLVEPRAPEQIAAQLLAQARGSAPAGLREHFLRHYTVEKFAERMKQALLDL